MIGITASGVAVSTAIGLNVALACFDLWNPVSPEGLLAGVNLAALAMLRSWHKSLVLAMGFVLYLIFNMFVCLMAINGAMIARDAWPLLFLVPTIAAAIALLAQGASVEWAPVDQRGSSGATDRIRSAARIYR